MTDKSEADKLIHPSSPPLIPYIFYQSVIRGLVILALSTIF
jgi:hypothetical protein